MMMQNKNKNIKIIWKKKENLHRTLQLINVSVQVNK